VLFLPLGFTRLICPTSDTVAVNAGPLAMLCQALLLALIGLEPNSGENVL